MRTTSFRLATSFATLFAISAVCPCVTPVSAQTAPAPRPSAAKRPAVRVPLPINVESPDWIDIDAISDDAISASMDALDRVQDMKIDATMAPLASLNLDFAPMIASLSGQAATFASDFARIAPIASFNLSGSPRAPWASADPADSLYRLARQSLNAGEYRRAADLFAQITRQYPTSQYRSDAAYWRAFALYRIGDTADLHEALIALDSGGASTTATTSRASARASAAIAKRATQDAAGAYTISSDVSASGAAALAKADGARVYFMNGARSSDTESAILAMRIRSALAARGDATAAAQIASTASAGGTSCDDEDAQLRVEALNALVQMDPKNAEPAITKVLARRDACSVPLRRGAIALAARTPDSQTTTLLISTARTDPAIEVQAEAIRGLSRVSDATATTALTDIATSSKNPALQRIAVRGLASQDSPAAQQAIRSFMTRADLPTDVRITALHYAGKSDLQIGDLAKMYDTSADRSTRSEIISLLEQRTEPEASDKLISIARTSTDPAMRRRAIEALTHKKDPRTAKLLMDILGK